ncbi:MAG: DUF4923 family protein [Bacteroides sp.]|nr:DUF4923 family protein [Bacteroides sp.]
MKKCIFGQLLVAALLLVSANTQAQSLKSLLSGVEKAVSTVTGTSTSSSMTGTWSYTGSALEFESDNLLTKAGGSVAASTVESKLDEQLTKIGITEGKLSFTFNTDSTFTATANSKNISGTYSYSSSTEKVKLKFAKVVSVSADVNLSSSSMDLLFDADKLLTVLTYLSSKSSNSTLQTISSLAESYDGMLVGFSLSKQ